MEAQRICQESCSGQQMGVAQACEQCLQAHIHHLYLKYLKSRDKVYQHAEYYQLAVQVFRSTDLAGPTRRKLQEILATSDINRLRGRCYTNRQVANDRLAREISQSTDLADREYLLSRDKKNEQLKVDKKMLRVFRGTKNLEVPMRKKLVEAVAASVIKDLESYNKEVEEEYKAAKEQYGKLESILLIAKIDERMERDREVKIEEEEQVKQEEM